MERGFWSRLKRRRAIGASVANDSVVKSFSGQTFSGQTNDVCRLLMERGESAAGLRGCTIATKCFKTSALKASALTKQQSKKQVRKQSTA